MTFFALICQLVIVTKCQKYALGIVSKTVSSRIVFEKKIDSIFYSIRQQCYYKYLYSIIKNQRYVKIS